MARQTSATMPGAAKPAAKASGLRPGRNRAAASWRGRPPGCPRRSRAGRRPPAGRGAAGARTPRCTSARPPRRCPPQPADDPPPDQPREIRARPRAEGRRQEEDGGSDKAGLRPNRSLRRPATPPPGCSQPGPNCRTSPPGCVQPYWALTLPRCRRSRRCRSRTAARRWRPPGTRRARYRSCRGSAAGIRSSAGGLGCAFRMRRRSLRASASIPSAASTGRAHAAGGRSTSSRGLGGPDRAARRGPDSRTIRRTRGRGSGGRSSRGPSRTIARGPPGR